MVSKEQYDDHHRRDRAQVSARERLTQMQLVHSEPSTNASQSTSLLLPSPLAIGDLALPSAVPVEPTPENASGIGNDGNIEVFTSAPSVEPPPVRPGRQSPRVQGVPLKAIVTAMRGVSKHLCYLSAIDWSHIQLIRSVKLFSSNLLCLYLPQSNRMGRYQTDEQWGALELKSDAVANYATLTHEAWLWQT